MKRWTTVHSGKMILPVSLLLLALAAGCGSGQHSRGTALESGREETEEEGKTGKIEKVERTEEREETDTSVSGEEDGDYVYLEKKKIRDMNDRSVVCEAYLPKGSEVGSGSAYFNEHGLYYFANVDSFGGSDFLYESFEDSYDLMLEYWRGADMDYTDIGSSGILENGDDRYYILTGRGVDYDGTPFEVRQLYYMDMQPSDACIEWRLEMSQEYADEETEAMLCEIEKCYGICLDDMKPGSPLKPDEQNPDDYAVREGQMELEDMDGYHYLGYAALSDYYGEAVCPVFVPKSKDTNMGKDHAYAFLHGVQVIVDVDELFYGNNLMTDMKYDFDIKYEYREDNPERIRNLEKKEMIPVPGLGDALYSVLSYEKKGYGEGEYFPKAEVLCYIRFQDNFYLAVEIFLNGEEYDASTNAVIRELETAYGIDLSEYYKPDAEAVSLPEETEDIVTLVNVLGSVESGVMETVSDTVLWFNATYSPLIYSNGWDWRLVGGLEPTKENERLQKQLLRSSWSVTDRESALEQAESLKEQGHRQRCREYMEELEQLGLLDLEEEEFQKEFRKSAIKDKSYRYEVAYQMHRAGLDADAMAAWDLCRVNQLYASYYVCGYMTYEEAMDASLENSLLLQGMYSSWEEMVESYMLGFRFWRNVSDEDAAVEERQRICDMLLEMENGPYHLDWGMELEKSW